MYNVDPSDNTKQIPKSRPVSAYGKAETPETKKFASRPSYVLVNKEGIYAFSYANTGSVGGSHDHEGVYVTGSVLDDAAGPMRLDIQPNAWRRTDGTGAVGDITFVYRGDVG